MGYWEGCTRERCGQLPAGTSCTGLSGFWLPLQKRHRSNDSTASGRDRSHSCDSTEALPCKLKEEPWLLEMCGAFLQQYIQYLQSMGFILVQVRPPSPTRRSVLLQGTPIPLGTTLGAALTGDVAAKLGLWAPGSGPCILSCLLQHKSDTCAGSPGH